MGRGDEGVEASGQGQACRVLKAQGKSVLDRGWGWGILKTQVKYKSHEAAGVFKEVSESLSTQECSACASRSGPKGLAGLGGWICSCCGAWDDRNQNAAQNILVTGLLDIRHEALREKGKSMSVEARADETDVNKDAAISNA